MRKNKLVVNRATMLTIALALFMIVALVGCNRGPGTTEKSDKETGQQENAQEDSDMQEEARFLIEGAYHPRTGAFDPRELFPGQTDIDPTELNTATQNLIESEESGDARTVFVMVSIPADDVIEFGNARGSASLRIKADEGGYASISRDSCPLNYDESSGYWSNLHNMGYLDTKTAYIDCVSGRTCYIVMEFSVDAELLANGAEATLTWGDISTDISLSTVQEVDTPSDMIVDLQN